MRRERNGKARKRRGRAREGRRTNYRRELQSKHFLSVGLS